MNKEELKGRVEEMLDREIRTLEYYFELYEDLAAERDDLHNSIIHTILNRQVYSKNKQIYMLGGAPANGKSAFVRSRIVKYPDSALKIDPDEIKRMLPEYEYMLDIREPDAAAIVHEESSYLSKNLRQIAIAEEIDLILDGVANDSFEKRKEDLESLKANGHHVRIDYVTLDTQLSLQLAEIRFQQTGRQVPETFIREAGRNLVALIPQLINNQLFEELYLWDTNLEKEPRLILSQKNGILEVLNETLYENFKKKEND